MDLWERGLHTCLVGDAEVAGAAREGKAASQGKEQDKALDGNLHSTLL